MTTNSKPAVFLDRDGVINENVDGDYVRSWDAFHFLPGALDAIAALTRAGLPIVVVTNQQGIGKGVMPAAEVDAIHQRMLAAITATGGRVDAVLYCPHLASDGCDCRKPQPGLLTRAAAQLGLDLARSTFVGDALSDVQAARAAGCRPILVRTGRGAAAVDALPPDLAGTSVADDLAGAVRLALAAASSG